MRRSKLTLGLGLLLVTVGQAFAQQAVEVAIEQQPNVAMPDAEKMRRPGFASLIVRRRDRPSELPTGPQLSVEESNSTTTNKK